MKRHAIRGCGSEAERHLAMVVHAGSTPASRFISRVRDGGEAARRASGAGSDEGVRSRRSAPPSSRTPEMRNGQSGDAGFLRGRSAGIARQVVRVARSPGRRELLPDHSLEGGARPADLSHNSRDVVKPGPSRLVRDEEIAGSNPAIPTGRGRPAAEARAGRTRDLDGTRGALASAARASTSSRENARVAQRQRRQAQNLVRGGSNPPSSINGRAWPAEEATGEVYGRLRQEVWAPFASSARPRASVEGWRPARLGLPRRG